jgi:hypothetical protein
MNTEIITLIGTIVTAVFVVINSVILYKLNKRSKAFDINIEEVHELNVKMHDRLVEAEDEIKSNKYPSDKTRKGLLYNSSRLMKYDDTILNDVNLLINNWTVMLSLKERGNIKDGELSKTRSEMISLIRKIKVKVDKLKAK